MPLVNADCFVIHEHGFTWTITTTGNGPNHDGFWFWSEVDAAAVVEARKPQLQIARGDEVVIFQGKRLPYVVEVVRQAIGDRYQGQL